MGGFRARGGRRVAVGEGSGWRTVAWVPRPTDRGGGGRLELAMGVAEWG